jgi:flagellar export protein FliJ
VARKFIFALTPLLDWRSRIVTQKQRELAICRSAVDECVRELQRLSDTRRTCGDALVASAGSPARDLQLRDAHIRAVEAAMAEQRRRRYELETECKRTRDELAIADRERRVIEKFEERARRAFESQEARREELELDEANARRHRKCGP